MDRQPAMHIRVALAHRGRDMVSRMTDVVADTLPKANRKAKRAAASRSAKADRPVRGLKAWAYSGVGLTLTLSGALNGLAFAEHAPSVGMGWALGVSIPALVLIFSRVSALLYQHGRRALAYCGAAATLSVLLLSVQHCAASIARLTGETMALAALMALAIDAGLVVCELATVRAK